MSTRAPMLVELGVGVLAVLVGLTAGGVGTAPSRAAGPPGPRLTSHGDGLSNSRGGYVMSPVALPAVRGPAVPVAFRILAPGGKPMTEYDVVHTKRLHLYLVRADLSQYQHLHPELSGDTWRAVVSIPGGGAYRLYAEFAPPGKGSAGDTTVLGLPFVVPGDATSVPLPAPALAAEIAGYSVDRVDRAHLTAGRPVLLKFQIKDSRTGSPAALEQYLGASAHASAFEARTRAMQHMHPALTSTADGTIILHAVFPRRGQQRLYLQFQAAGTLHQVAFTLFVA